MKTIKTILTVAGVAMAATAAHAGIITGQINLDGNDVNLDNTILTSDTKVTSITGAYVGGGSTGSYAGITQNNIATFNISPGAPLLLTAGAQTISDLWSTTEDSITYDFNLSSITSWSATAFSGTLVGQGTLQVSGDPDVNGNFVLTLNDASGGSSGTATLSFSASSSVAPGVPDGGMTMSLLGGAFVGLGALRRKLG